MQLEFQSREVYRNKQDQDFLSELEAHLRFLFSAMQTNYKKGCEEILTREIVLITYAGW
jgi:hypothetical protein